jgi:cytosine/adenosine deaminase-related metal-dependent hydrolase
MNQPEVISGIALLRDDLTPEPVDIEVTNGIITAIEENPRAPPIWICPAFFNAHTHLGDTIAMDCAATGALEELVTPPAGLKHRLLAAASRKQLIDGMNASIQGMIAGGTCGCADFREGGIDGVRALKEAASGLPFQPVIFGRDGGEGEAEGLGISSTRDVNNIEQQVSCARKQNKKIAFHAGERDAGDIDTALAYDPDLLIHMTHATTRQIRECAEREIPVVICPRSNWVLGVTTTSRHPPVKKMLEHECTVLLGTDNVMFVPPDMFSEMAFLLTVYHSAPREIIRAAVRGSGLSGSSWFIEKGNRAAFFTVDPSRSSCRFSQDPLTSIIKRAGAGAIGKNVFNL